MIRTITADEIREHLPVRTAITALTSYFSGHGRVEAPQRTQLPLGDGVMLTMPAIGQWGTDSAAGGIYDAASGDVTKAVGGVKVVTVRSANAEIGAPTVQALYLLFGGESLAPLAVIDGPGLTNLRTSAVSAVATEQLARPDAETLLIFGAGAQARAHLAAIAAVRPIREVIICSRTPSRAGELVAAAEAHGLSARIGGVDDVARADIVACCTTSVTPLFDGALLRSGTHVVAVGGYRPDMRELDEVTMRSGPVVVEDRAAATGEAGEFVLPAAAGRPVPVAADLYELCSGTTVRTDDREITVFKSVGLAAEDLVLADAIFRATE